MPKLAVALALVAPLLLAPSIAAAVEITINVEDCLGNPDDPGSLKLRLHAEAAARIWMDLLPADDLTVYNIDICWDHSSSNTPTEATLGAGWPPPWFGIWIENAPPSPWFFDPDPLHSTAYNLNQVLFRDLDAVEQSTFFEDEVPPDLLEVGFLGGPAPTGSGPAAIGKFDLLSVILHEIGHKVGINYAWGEDYDLESFLIGGFADTDIRATLGHLTCDRALMSATFGTNMRRLPSAIDLFAIVDDQDYTSIRLRRMDLLDNAFGILPNGWDQRMNWEGGSLPVDTTDVTLRKSAMVFGGARAGTLALGFPFTAPVDGGLRLRLLPGADLAVTGRATVGRGEELSVMATAHLGVAVLRLVAADLVLDGGTVDVVEQLQLQPVANVATASRIVGHGRVTVGGALLNQGALVAADQGTGDPLAIDTGGGLLDLGGAGAQALAEDGDLAFSNGTTLPFAGTLRIGGGHRATFRGDLTLQDGGLLSFTSGPGAVATFAMPSAPSPVALTVHGLVAVQGHAALEAAVTFGSTSTFDLAPGAQLDLARSTIYDGAVCKSSATGTLRQLGDAEVAGTAHLDVATYDWDGDGHTRTTIHRKAELFITAQHIGDDDRFHGTVENLGGLLSVNTYAPGGGAQPWTLGADGWLHLASVKERAVVVGSDVVLMDGGHVIGLGDFGASVVNRGGVVEPAGLDGDPVGTIAVTAKATYSQGGSGALWIDLDTAPGAHRNDLLRVKGNAWLGGSLVVSRLGPEPKLGDTFDIVTAGHVIGAFTDLHLPVLTDLAWDVQYLTNVPTGGDLVRLVVVHHP